MKPKKGMIPLKEFAKRAGVPYTTVMDWAKAGRINGVVFEETPLGKYWTAPESALKGLQRPKVGRPPKQKAGENVTPAKYTANATHRTPRSTQKSQVAKAKGTKRKS